MTKPPPHEWTHQFNLLDKKVRSCYQAQVILYSVGAKVMSAPPVMKCGGVFLIEHASKNSPKSQTAAEQQHMETIKTEKSFGWETTRDHQN